MHSVTFTMKTRLTLREFWTSRKISRLVCWCLVASANIDVHYQILDELLEMRPFGFALDVAALSSRREYLNLDKWLADNVAAHGADFLHGVIQFLDTKMESEKLTRVSVPATEPRTMTLSPQTVTIFLRVLRNK